MFNVFLVLASLTTYSSAQETLISGRVMDGSNGVPLAGATVSLHDAEIVTMTDAEGHFIFDSATTKQADVRTKPPTIASAEMISFSKEGYDTVSRSINASSSNQNAVLTLSGKVTYVCTTADSRGRWQIARTIFDLASKTSEITYLTATKWWNFKPNFSPDGSQLTFFRRYAVNGPCCESWRSSICVMNANGSGVHEIIEGESSFNTEPYWSRDGSNRISFNRMNVETAGPYWNDSDGLPGAEQKLAPWGWVNPHLADGRLFIQQRAGKSFLATPRANGKARYVQIQRPDNHFIHKIALSQDETMIAYQKWIDRDHNMYKGGVMVYAKFDATTPSITDEVIFDQLDPSTMAWYVSISTDNRFLLFARDGAIMQHDVETGETIKVSADSDPYKAYPTYTTFSK